jgi:hypothetical protein
MILGSDTFKFRGRVGLGVTFLIDLFRAVIPFPAGSPRHRLKRSGHLGVDRRSQLVGEGQ